MASRVAVGCAYLYAIKTKAGDRRMRRVYYYNNILLYRIVMQDTSLLSVVVCTYRRRGY